MLNDQRVERPPDRPLKENALSGRALEVNLRDAEQLNYKPAPKAWQETPDEYLENLIAALTREAVDLIDLDHAWAREAWERVALLVAERSPTAIARLEAQRGLRGGA